MTGVMVLAMDGILNVNQYSYSYSYSRSRSRSRSASLRAKTTLLLDYYRDMELSNVRKLFEAPGCETSFSGPVGMWYVVWLEAYPSLLVLTYTIFFTLLYGQHSRWPLALFERSRGLGIVTMTMTMTTTAASISLGSLVFHTSTFKSQSYFLSMSMSKKHEARPVAMGCAARFSSSPILSLLQSRSFLIRSELI